jgi:hypothetical protein
MNDDEVVAGTPWFKIISRSFSAASSLFLSALCVVLLSFLEFLLPATVFAIMAPHD